jgi:PAS domain S-box-containing protein
MEGVTPSVAGEGEATPFEPGPETLAGVAAGGRSQGGSGDITELQQAVRLLEIQRDLAVDLCRAANRGEAFGYLLDAAMRLPGFDCGGIYTRDQSSGALVLIVHHGLTEPFVRAAAYHPGDSPHAQLVARGELVYAVREDLPGPVGSSLAREGLRALAAVPLKGQGQVIGVLNVSSHCHPRIEPSSRVALESLAAQAEGAISLVHEREGRHKAERELRLAVEAAELGTWVADFSSGFFDASLRARALHGIPPDLPLTTESSMALIHLDHRQEVAAGLQRAITGGEAFSCEYRTTSGDERWIASQARLFDDGGSRRLYGIVRDITPRKWAEEELREARDRLEWRVAERTTELKAANVAMHEQALQLGLALDAAQAGTSTLELATNTLKWDNRQRALFGFADDVPVSLEELMERVHPEDRDHLSGFLQAMTYTDVGKVWHHECRILHPVLGERWIGGMGRAECDAEGRVRRMSGINFDITDLKRKEGILRESEQKFRKLHESMMDAFVSVDMSGRIVEFNRAYQDMLGYPADELRCLTYVDITPERWHDHEARIVADEILANGFSELYEKEYRRKDGSVFPVELRTFLLRDGAGNPSAMWAIVRDISERKQEERTLHEWNEKLERRVAARTSQLRRSEQRFRQLAEATFEGIAVSEGGRMTDGNPQLAEMYGYSLDEMLGRPVVEFAAPESREVVNRHMRAGFEGPYEYTALRKDGSKFPVEARACIRSWHGKQTRVTALRDLTSVRQAAEQLRAQRIQLEQAQRLALVSEISTGVLHQIAQPLTAVTNNAAAAKALIGRCESQQCGSRQIIEDIEQDLMRARQTMDHIRMLAHPERSTRVRTSPNDLVSGVLRLLHEEIRVRAVDVAFDAAVLLPAVAVDRVQIEQVVFNLVRNAFEAVADLDPERREVRLTTRATDNGSVELLVRDNGHGIAADVKPQLFSPFVTTKPEGTGIGLRLSQTIVVAHGGTIEGFNNTDGPGASFRVVLPAAAPE